MLHGTLYRSIAACTLTLLLVAIPAAASAQQLDWNQKAVTPVLEKNITSTDPDVWNTIAALISDSKGNLYVLDNQEQQVNAFSPDGKLLRSYGRKGQGPGEFQRISRIQIIRDTLWVADNNTTYVTGFDLTSGKFRTTTGTFPNGRGGQIMHIAFSPLGQWMLSQTGTTALGGTALPNPQSPMQLNHRTGNRDGPTVVSIEQPRPLVTLVKGTYGRGFSSQPFPSHPLWTVTHDGGALLYLDRKPAQRAGQGQVVIKSFAPTGALNWTRTLTYAPKPLTRDDLNRAVEKIAMPQRAGNIVIEIDRVALMDSIVRPAFWTPVRGMIMGKDGTIWLQEEGGTEPTQKYYWRLSPTGVPDLRVVLPMSRSSIMATRDILWVSSTDRDGMAVLGRYRVKSP